MPFKLQECFSPLGGRLDGAPIVSFPREKKTRDAKAEGRGKAEMS